MAVLMELARVLICELNDLQIIELREVGGERRFPILIGIAEAEAIKRRLQGVQVPRPMTHDLLANIIEAFGGTLESIAINDLSDHTFYAKLNIRGADDEVIEIDSRPSDAIALGVSQDVPIYVEEHVLEDAQNNDE